MVRLHEDVDGCGCLRCQGIDHEVLRRSLPDVLYWSGTLPVARPSTLLVLGLVGLVQVAVVVAPTALSPALVAAGVVGVFVGRGYVGVVGCGRLGGQSPTPAAALGVVARRLPAFLGASVAAILWLALSVAAVVALVAPGIRRVAAVAGTDPVVAEFAVLFLVVALVVHALLKCCFVPEACFVGGYGPLASLAVSWRITSVHRLKAALVLAGFGALLAVGIALDSQLAGGGPVALTLEVGNTAVVLRSFGLSAASTPRFVLDLGVTALYSGVFVHQYVESSLRVTAR